jgi:hypothetical protein
MVRSLFRLFNRLEERQQLREILLALAGLLFGKRA